VYLAKPKILALRFKTNASDLFKTNASDLQQTLLPRIRNHWIFVKVEAVAHNLTDWKHMEMAAPGPTFGCDVQDIA